jgi:hypothetical protein
MSNNSKHTKLVRELTDEFFINNKALSDIDYGYNSETGEYDIPKLEWDYYMGRYWTSYESEEARTIALDEYQADLDDYVAKGIAALKKKKRDTWLNHLASKNTIGNMFPQLSKLKFA